MLSILQHLETTCHTIPYGFRAPSSVRCRSNYVVTVVDTREHGHIKTARVSSSALSSLALSSDSIHPDVLSMAFEGRYYGPKKCVVGEYWHYENNLRTLLSCFQLYHSLEAVLKTLQPSAHEKVGDTVHRGVMPALRNVCGPIPRLEVKGSVKCPKDRNHTPESHQPQRTVHVTVWYSLATYRCVL